jgi:hypothetical protein
VSGVNSRGQLHASTALEAAECSPVCCVGPTQKTPIPGRAVRSLDRDPPCRIETGSPVMQAVWRRDNGGQQKFANMREACEFGTFALVLFNCFENLRTYRNARKDIKYISVFSANSVGNISRHDNYLASYAVDMRRNARKPSRNVRYRCPVLTSLGMCCNIIFPYNFFFRWCSSFFTPDRNVSTLSAVFSQLSFGNAVIRHVRNGDRRMCASCNVCLGGPMHSCCSGGPLTRA